LKIPYGGGSARPRIRWRLRSVPGTRDVERDRARPQTQRVAVSIAVQPDAVAGGDDFGGECGRARNLLADEEERRGRLEAREHLQYRSGPLWMRSVVEVRP